MLLPLLVAALYPRSWPSWLVLRGEAGGSRWMYTTWLCMGDCMWAAAAVYMLQLGCRHHKTYLGMRNVLGSESGLRKCYDELGFVGRRIKVLEPYVNEFGAWRPLSEGQKIDLGIKDKDVEEVLDVMVEIAKVGWRGSVNTVIAHAGHFACYWTSGM